MSELEVYFKNHNRTLRFPWSIYHKPLLEDLEKFLKSNVTKGKKILVIGPGDFQEFELLISFSSNVSILDIDPRVLEVTKSRHGSKILNYYLVNHDLSGYPLAESYDIIYAKEVIEHLPAYNNFLCKIHSVLKPKGKIWLSTPNYGFFLLPFLEATILELIAKVSGFSRKNIHPSKFTKPQLQSAAEKAGFKNLILKVTFLRLALTLIGSKE